MYRPYSSPVGGSGFPTDVQSTIRGFTQDFSMNFNTGNYDQVAALFAADGLFMAPHNESIVGPKPIERKLREFGESGYQDLRLETIRVDSSGDMAMEIGRYSVSITSQNASTTTDRGKYLKVWRRLGAWRLLADCWSSNLPAASANGEEKSLPAANKVTIISNEVSKSA